VNRTSISR